MRRPDVAVDCATLDPSSYKSGEPTVFVEALSPSTRGADLAREANEHRSRASLKAFVIIEQDVAVVSLWARGEEGEWDEREAFTSLDEVLAFPLSSSLQSR